MHFSFLFCFYAKSCFHFFSVNWTKCCGKLASISFPFPFTVLFFFPKPTWKKIGREESFLYLGYKSINRRKIYPQFQSLKESVTAIFGTYLIYYHKGIYRLFLLIRLAHDIENILGSKLYLVFVTSFYSIFSSLL